MNFRGEVALIARAVFNGNFCLTRGVPQGRVPSKLLWVLRINNVAQREKGAAFVPFLGQSMELDLVIRISADDVFDAIGREDGRRLIQIASKLSSARLPRSP